MIEPGLDHRIGHGIRIGSKKADSDDRGASEPKASEPDEQLQQQQDVPGADYATEPENGDLHDTRDDTEAQHRHNNSHNNGRREDQRNNDHRHCDANDVRRRRGEQQRERVTKTRVEAGRSETEQKGDFGLQ